MCTLLLHRDVTSEFGSHIAMGSSNNNNMRLVLLLLFFFLRRNNNDEAWRYNNN